MQTLGQDGSGQCILVGRHGRHIALRAAVLTDDPAGVTLRETIPLLDGAPCLSASLEGLDGVSRSASRGGSGGMMALRYNPGALP